MLVRLVWLVIKFETTRVFAHFLNCYETSRVAKTRHLTLEYNRSSGYLTLSVSIQLDFQHY